MQRRFESRGRPQNRDGDKRREGSGRGQGPGGPGAPRFFQKRVCRFCCDRSAVIDYKDVERLRRFLTEKGKIMPRRITGNCTKHQRVIGRAIKRARHAAFLAFQLD